MKFIKVVFSIVLLLAFVCVLVFVSLIYILDPNKIKPVLADNVRKQTGYQLGIQGDLTWTLFPRVGVKAERVMLIAPHQSGDFIELQDVRIGTELAQLIKGREVLDGDIFIANVTFTHMHLQNVNAKLHWEEHLLTIDQMNAALYGGTLAGTLQVKELAQAPQWGWNLQMNNVQLEGLIKDANGPDARLRLTGEGQVKFAGTSEGSTRADVLTHLNGSTQFMVSNGTVQGIDLNYFVTAANALITRQALPAPSDMKATAFNTLSGTATIQHGIATTDNTLLTSPTFMTKIQGNVGLLPQTLSFRLQVKPLIATNIPLEIPVQVTGDLSHPEIQVDTSELGKFIAKQNLNELKEKALDEIKEKAHGKVGQLLQQLNF